MFFLIGDSLSDTEIEKQNNNKTDRLHNLQISKKNTNGK